MTEFSGWHEVESRVYCPGRWLVLSVGGFFFLIGVVGIFAIGAGMPPGLAVWIARGCAAVFAALGATIFLFAIGSIIQPVYVRHAAREVLPHVPLDPVLCEGAVVHGRVTHELVEDADGWQFRPAAHLWRSDKRFLFGFGIPFMTVFSGVLSWIFHSRLNSWPLSVLFATSATLVCGGLVLLLVGLLMRASYRRLCRLSIPRHDGDLELDAPEESDPAETDLTVGLKWAFLGETKRKRLTIPREIVSAVQLCPWKYLVGGSSAKQITWAVQGLLVLTADNVHHRLPILLTSDFVGAARFMQKLAGTLQVPYLFCADAAGWEAEELRAKTRRPLRAGGIQS